MERAETRIDRELVERARERARSEGRGESEVIEEALRRYLGEAGDDRRPGLSESLENARRRREALGITELSEEEAMRIAIEEQHAYRRGEQAEALLAVVDPNVLISSRISDSGPPARIVRAADEGAFELALSGRLLEELYEVLMRPRFRRYATEQEVDDFLYGLREKGLLFEDAETERLVPDDPKDDYLVALARASGADYLVSGDPHLAQAENEAAIIVLTPRQFSELLEKESL